MPKIKTGKLKNLKNLNKFKKENSKMETDQTSDEEDLTYDPVIEDDLNENSISDEIMGGLLDLVFSDNSIRNVSVFSFGLLLKFGINFSEIKTFFATIGLQKAGTSRDNLIKLKKEGLEKQSGGYRFSNFYEDFPEIEILAKVFVSERTQTKSCSFKVADLCEYIDKMFYEISNTVKETEFFVRSETAVRQDIKNWGLEYGSSSSIYFEGHERPDVVVDRQVFTEYFSSRKEHYYSVDETPGSVDWINPIEKPCVLLFHDESTFRCNEQTAKRWFKKGKEPFVSKGKGRSLMVSDFLVSHPSGPFFKLNDAEWQRCILKYPNIVDFHGVHYEDKTCTGSIQPGAENYFCSETILCQFERLFQMLEFKEAFNIPVKHDIEIVIDNARTHTAQVVNINDFRLHPKGHCPVETLNYIDESGVEKTIDCFDENGESKGLKIIAIELGYSLPEKIRIDEIRKILIEHPAFSPTKKLTKLAEKYGVKIMFCPKFH